MSPESSNDFFFRFIEQDIDEDYVPFGTYGWNAAELIVKDVDQSAEKLIGSPFEVIGEPADLSFTDQIRQCRFWDHQKKLYILPSSNLNWMNLIARPQDVILTRLLLLFLQERI